MLEYLFSRGRSKSQTVIQMKVAAAAGVGLMAGSAVLASADYIVSAPFTVSSSLGPSQPLQNYDGTLLFQEALTPNNVYLQTASGTVTLGTSGQNSTTAEATNGTVTAANGGVPLVPVAWTSASSGSRVNMGVPTSGVSYTPVAVSPTGSQIVGYEGGTVPIVWNSNGVGGYTGTTLATSSLSTTFLARGTDGTHEVGNAGTGATTHAIYWPSDTSQPIDLGTNPAGTTQVSLITTGVSGTTVIGYETVTGNDNVGIVWTNAATTPVASVTAPKILTPIDI